jgi:hypothetical protein
MADTLRALMVRLDDVEVGHGSAAAMGLRRESDGVYVQWSSRASTPAGTEDLGDAPIVDVPLDEDPRPLYFLPWDPGAHQSPEMEGFCKHLLFEQLRVLALAEVGNVEPPQRLELNMLDLLNKACHGLISKWRKRNDVQRVADATRQFFITTLAPMQSQISLLREQGQVSLTVGTESVKRGVMELLEKAHTESVDVPDQQQLPLDFDA